MAEDTKYFKALNDFGPMRVATCGWRHMLRTLKTFCLLISFQRKNQRIKEDPQKGFLNTKFQNINSCNQKLPENIQARALTPI